MGEVVTVSFLAQKDTNDYESFLASVDGATIYHSILFRDLLVDILAPEVEYVLARRGQTIVGVLPLLGKSGSHGTILNSLPFFGSYGGVFAVDAEGREALVTWFLSRLGEGNVSAATLISNPFDPGGEIDWGKDCETDQRIAQWTPLPSGPERNSLLMEMIDGSARRNIRKADKAGVTVSVENSAFEFLELTHRQNMAEIGGTAKPHSFFSAVQKVLCADRDYRIYIAKHDGVPVGAILLFYFKDFIEYITPVTSPGCRDLQPTAAILYRAMLDGMNEGRKVWNWGGTWLGQDGVYRFKRKWGAQESRYTYTTFVLKPEVKGVEIDTLREQYPYFYAFPFTPKLGVDGASVPPHV